MSEQMGRGEAPATVEQVAAAMAALGLYGGENTADRLAPSGLSRRGDAR